MTRFGDTDQSVVLLADSLFSTSSGKDIKQLLSLGPKIFQLPIRVMQPGTQCVLLEDSFGIGFVGNVIIALAVVSRAAAIFFNLYRTSQLVPPLIRFAQIIGSLHEEIASQFIAKAEEKRTDYLLLGKCPSHKTPAAATIHAGATIRYQSYTFATEQQLIVLGDEYAAIFAEIQQLRVEEPNPHTAAWLPKSVLEQRIKGNRTKTIGGFVHGGILLPSGFTLRSISLIVRETRKSTITTPIMFPPVATHLKIDGWSYMPHPLEHPTWQDKKPKAATHAQMQAFNDTQVPPTSVV